MTETTTKPTVLQTLGMLIAITIFVFVYATLCSLVGVTLIHGGFLFLFYWAGIRSAARGELLPSLVGALGGIGLAYLVIALPAQMGAAGYGFIAIAVFAAIFMMIRSHLPLLINNAFMLYLTVFTIPGVAAFGDYWQIMVAVLIAGGLSAALLTAGKMLAARNAKA